MRVNTYTVRLTVDKQEIHEFLQRDPVFAAYAIGDLEPAQFAQCTWYLAQNRGETAALVLVYRGLEPPVVLTMGQVDGVSAVFAQVPLPRQVYMSAQVEHLPAFRARFDFSADRVRPMLRLGVTPGSFQPVVEPDGLAYPFAMQRRLGMIDVDAVQELFALGGRFAPDAFSPFQLWDGVFYGIELDSGPTRRRRLVAVAGTHIVAPNWGVAALGNLYTHPAYRGRGYGQMVSSAVTAELLRRDLLVVLNVDRANATAMHIYRKLGYRVHCPFYEGIGVMRV